MDLSREFSTEFSLMAKKHLKKCSFSLDIREMQVTMTDILSYTCKKKKAKIKNQVTCCGGCGARGTVLHCWWECNLQPLQKLNWLVSQKTGNISTFKTYQYHSWVYTQKMCHKDTCTTMFISA